MPTKTVTGVVIAIVLVVAIAITFALLIPHKPKPAVEKNVMPKLEVGERLKLPAPNYRSNTSVEEALTKRRSVRFYSGEGLSINEVSQLLWAAQGITGTGRTAPSAGALYPLELYLVVGDVEGLDNGVYQYRPVAHELEKRVTGDAQMELSKAAVGQNQEHVRDAAVVLVFTAVYERTTGKYGERGFRYVHMEAGHAAQNVYLQAESLELGTVVIGAFSDAKVKELVNAEEQEEPLYIMPVGRTL
ncbi:MAG: SagB/ThcOx family dehydrogenase [Euryarchaeota archaeon]|nr:SagB/ThcOx family dehydrogenase [Euryarchaeota archaeon]